MQIDRDGIFLTNFCILFSKTWLEVQKRVHGPQAENEKFLLHFPKHGHSTIPNSIGFGRKPGRMFREKLGLVRIHRLGEDPVTG